MTGDEYALDNAAAEAGQRFGALEALFDGPTVGFLTRLGVSPGWSCWEVGAGSGSVARWLAGAVAPTGTVLATDLDLSQLRDQSIPGLTAKVHDVVRDETPQEAFDLVHARLVLVHLRERARVLDSLARALRPGGWILIEDFDHGFLYATTPVTAEETRVRRVQRAFTQLLAQRGADTEYARRLPDLLRELGLRDVAGEGRMVFGVGASPAATVYKSGFKQVGDQMVDAGLCTREELETVLELLDDPDSGFAMPLLISAWGRRPAMLA